MYGVLFLEFRTYLEFRDLGFGIFVILTNSCKNSGHILPNTNTSPPVEGLHVADSCRGTLKLKPVATFGAYPAILLRFSHSKAV